MRVYQGEMTPTAARPNVGLAVPVVLLAEGTFRLWHARRFLWRYQWAPFDAAFNRRER